MLIETDPHSFYTAGQARMQHLSWSIVVDFNAKVLSCVAELTFERPGEIVLDTRDLDIEKVTDKDGKSVAYALGVRDMILGSPLALTVPEDKTIIISYKTRPDASGLQWLSPLQTSGKEHPFLFSQGEAIHARSYVPCQDSPGVRFTFDAKIAVPRELRGLIAAPEFKGRIEDGAIATEAWSMPYPIPAYLLAMAVGDLETRKLSDKTSIWAEPNMIEKAAKEFEDLPSMMAESEKLFGEYLWGQYAVLVMPSSFPYGGMENPCLSFVTPSLVVGDKSAVWVVIHELAHSWTGNLVTNETWRDFWLNEGWTVYAEKRVSEIIFGKEATTVLSRLLEREFERDMKNFNSHPLFTALAADITDIDPDDNFSRVPYFMGSMFLRRIEEAVGRGRFDEVIHTYIEEFKFKSITTARFLSFISRELPGVLEEVRAWEWVYEAGLPSDAPLLTSPAIKEIEKIAIAGEVPPSDTKWSSSEMQLYLELLPRPFPVSGVQALDEYFHLSDVLDVELRWSYLILAIESGHTAVLDKVEHFLKTQGRMRYLKPMYLALSKTPDGLASAQKIFAEARSGYHPIAATQVARILNVS